jgi:VWFA-related protein
LIKNRLMAFIFLFLLLPIAFLGCGGGGDSSPPPPSPSIEVLPASYNFGSITPGNSPAPLEVEIANNGTAGLNVSDITLSDTTNFSLDLSKGLSPCTTASSSIAPGEKCTAEVTFNPGSGLDAAFDANLTISSNDPDNSTLNVPLQGAREAISELHVKINQVETCPSPSVTAYVSVTDQGGYSVITLLTGNFSVTETGTPNADASKNASFISDTVTLSVALVMDYSGSITELPDVLGDMQDSAVNFVGNLGPGDEAEIVKFAETNEVVAPGFTSDTTLLEDAILAPASLGTNTALYDAIVKAVDDTSLRSKNRRAIIVMTDGMDDDGSHSHQLSVNTLNDVINDAKNNGIPIFTIGLGGVINSNVLQQIADDTGGQYYAAATSDNLRTIYQQLADVLFKHQYIVTYSSGLLSPATASLNIKATLPAVPPAPAVEGEDTREIEFTPCP